MCAVSNVGDFYLQRQWPAVGQGIAQQGQLGGLNQPFDWSSVLAGVTRQEFDALKKDVLEMKEALLKAKAEDVKAGNPDCEMESKVALLKKIAEVVGVSLDDVFKKPVPNASGALKA